jgi:hypothetical protein
MAPWMIRNRIVSGEWTMSTEAWQAMAMANNDSGGTHMTAQGIAAMPPVSISESEVVREARYRLFVVKWIKENPGRYLALVIRRVCAFWSPLPNIVTGTQAIVGATFSAVLLIGLGMFVIMMRSQLWDFLPILAVLGAFTATSSLVMVATRFRLPIYPYVEILAVQGWLTACRRINGLRAA